jgi:hypothetical protein
MKSVCHGSVLNHKENLWNIEFHLLHSKSLSFWKLYYISSFLIKIIDPRYPF